MNNGIIGDRSTVNGIISCKYTAESNAGVKGNHGHTVTTSNLHSGDY